MQENPSKYDVAIIGGGLSGLALSIQLARKNHTVILFEKEKYPFHKVCGEYISMESWNFLESLGLPFSTLSLPKIDTLNLTAPNGKSFTTKLPLGGFGISRYKIDNLLSALAKESGVHLLDETKVENAYFAEDRFLVNYFSKHNKGIEQIEATVCCGAYGKRSNLDVKWKREFLLKTDPRIDNYIAVKYHVKTSWPANIIGLHNFRNGYCGISQIEEEKYCLCYLTTAANLKKNNNSISSMQENILFRNPVLREIFSSSKFLFSFPITISQISFGKKSLVENNILMLGDAAGMITPLCGNGMSMALNASKLATLCIGEFLDKKISRNEMAGRYKILWNKEFSTRLTTGRILQRFFGSEFLSNVFVTGFKTFPFLAQSIIRKTHGKSF
jgi:flavin-dependent dehydrogenase